MGKLLLALLFIASSLFAQDEIKRHPIWEDLGAGVTSPKAQYNINPFGNQLGNLGATGTRWNFLYTDTTITNHLTSTTLSGGIMSGTSLALGGATIGTNALAVTGTTIISGQTSVGTSILDGILSVVSNVGDVPMVVRYKQFRTSSSFINFDFYKAYGTEASPTSVGSSSGLFQFTANGYATDGFYAAARIGMQVDDLGVGSGDMPGQIFFQTSPDGSATLVTRMIIDNAGTITFGTTKNIGVDAVYAGAITSSGLIGNSAQQTKTLDTLATTFAVTKNVVTVTGNVGANTIATITGAAVGVYTFIFVDALVTITDTDAHTANTVDLAGTATNFTSADDKVLQLVFDGVSFYQISVSAN